MDLHPWNRSTRETRGRDAEHPAQVSPGPGSPDADETAAMEVLGDTVTDPAAQTEVLVTADPGASEAIAGPFTLSRAAAAEIGIYVGAALASAAVTLMTVRGWGQWSELARTGIAGSFTLGLLALGMWLRLPRTRALRPQRRRAISSLLVVGSGLLLAQLTVVFGPVSHGGYAPVLILSLGLALVTGVNLVARTALSETSVLVILAGGLVVGAGWLGPWAWVSACGLGLAWAGLAWRVLRGQRTGVVAGGLLALSASAVVAGGPWSWPARGALAVVGGYSLIVFLRGGRNVWLAVGAGCFTALGGSLAGDLLGPVLAMFCGGVATMAVSWLALRSTGRQSVTTR